MERKQQAGLTLTAADTQGGRAGGGRGLCKDLACFFSGGGQRRAKLVGPALLLDAIHTHTQFLPSCCLPDTEKKGLSSSREFNETQIKDSRSCGRPAASLLKRRTVMAACEHTTAQITLENFPSGTVLLTMFNPGK